MFESLFNLKEGASALCLIAVLAYSQVCEQFFKSWLKFRINFCKTPIRPSFSFPHPTSINLNKYCTFLQNKIPFVTDYIPISMKRGQRTGANGPYSGLKEGIYSFLDRYKAPSQLSMIFWYLHRAASS